MLIQNLEMSNGGPFFKDFVNRDQRNNNVPLPRYIPSDRMMVPQKTPLHPITYTASNIPPANIMNNLKPMSEEGLAMSQISSNQTSCNQDSNIRMPRNVFKEERIIREHPIYQGAKVNIEPKTPIPRDVPHVMHREMRKKMADIRLQQFNKTDGREITTPHLEASKYGYMMIKQQLPRMKPLREVVSQGPHQNITVSQQNPSVNVQQELGWRNLRNYVANPAAYEPRPIIKDYRLEKRKERQEAYQRRRDEQKKKEEALINQILANKKQWIQNDLKYGSYGQSTSNSNQTNSFKTIGCGGSCGMQQNWQQPVQKRVTFA